jgi:hypothetical protein
MQPSSPCHVALPAGGHVRRARLNPYALRYPYLWKTTAGVADRVRLTLSLADCTMPWIGVALEESRLTTAAPPGHRQGAVLQEVPPGVTRATLGMTTRAWLLWAVMRRDLGP